MGEEGVIAEGRQMGEEGVIAEGTHGRRGSHSRGGTWDKRES